MKIELKELPNNDFTYMGISSDIVKSIIVDNIPVGIVYLSDVMDDGIYMEWIEFLEVFQRKHLLRPVMHALFEEYGALYFESCDELKKKYDAIGAVEGEYDEDREMTSYSYGA
nr:hypothetical protein [uncultured Butyrivibrio sp.]